MVYINRRTAAKVVLSKLDAQQQKFYRDALEKFRGNVPWSEFWNFAFGMKSPLYSHRTSHLDVLRDPLYEALTDMWLELGVRQGLVAETQPSERRAHAQRRSKARGRQTANRRDSAENSKLAPAHSLTGTHS